MNNTCRTCLSQKGNKDFIELEAAVNEQNMSEDSSTSKLCIKCFKKIVSFHKFKKIALKNDEHWNDLNSKNQIYFPMDEIKNEFTFENSSPIIYEINNDDDDNDVKLEVKQELDLKEEDSFDDLLSDDEILSVLKKVKYEKLAEESKENAPYRKKRGRPKKLKSDISKQTKPVKEVCEECGKAVWNLKEHSLLHRPPGERKRIKCKTCDKLFSSYSARYRHYKIKHLGIKQHCDICNKDIVSVKQHIKIVHNTELLQYSCVSCGRRFISQSALDSHTIVHTKDRPFECDICKNTYRSKLALEQHKRQVHDKEKTHLCQFCSKSFFKKYHLQVHMRSHTKERPYKCPECQKFFSSSTTLKNHRLIHEEGKKFECTLCEMTFKKPGYLRVHMISHTRVRPHACKYCGICFGRTDHRKRHEYTAHEKHFGTA